MTTPPDQGLLRPLRQAESPLPEDARMAALFGHVDPLDPLSEISALRIRRNLERAIQEQEAAREARRFPTWLRRTVAVAASLVLLQAAAAAAFAVWPAARHRIFGGQSKAPNGALDPTPTGAPIPSTTPPLNLPSQPLGAIAKAPEASSLPARSPDSSVARVAENRHQRARSLEATSPVFGPPGVSATLPGAPAAAKVSDDPDVTLYTQALSQLNVQHDAAGALLTLQAYRQQHPRGLFENEAEVAEVRADLMMGKRSDALAMLDTMQNRGFHGVPQASELRLLRGELLAMDGRCGEAVPALAPYIDGSADGLAGGSDRERALYTRATCRARLGDEAGSRQDVRDYLREFPQGRFADRIRGDLAKQPGVAE